MHPVTDQASLLGFFNKETEKILILSPLYYRFREEEKKHLIGLLSGQLNNYCLFPRQKRSD